MKTKITGIILAFILMITIAIAMKFAEAWIVAQFIKDAIQQ